VTRPED